MVKANTLWFLIVIGALVGFLIARLAYKNEITDVYVDNPTMVKQITELSTLEVQGEARLNESNTGGDKSVWQDIKNYFGERTLLLNIPYTAKYGCKLGDDKISVTKAGENQLKITLAPPSLLSFEMRLDKMQQFARNGAFVFQKDDKFKQPIQNLFSQTRTKMETDAQNQKKARENIEKTLSDFFKPAGIKITLDFKP